MKDTLRCQGGNSAHETDDTEGVSAEMLHWSGGGGGAARRDGDDASQPGPFLQVCILAVPSRRWQAGDETGKLAER